MRRNILPHFWISMPSIANFGILRIEWHDSLNEYSSGNFKNIEFVQRKQKFNWHSMNFHFMAVFVLFHCSTETQTRPFNVTLEVEISKCGTFVSLIRLMDFDKDTISRMYGVFYESMLRDWQGSRRDRISYGK